MLFVTTLILSPLLRASVIVQETDNLLYVVTPETKDISLGEYNGLGGPKVGQAKLWAALRLGRPSYGQTKLWVALIMGRSAHMRATEISM